MGKVINTDELREFLEIPEKCEECSCDRKFCEYDQIFTLRTICDRINDAIYNLPDVYHNCEDCRSKYRGLCRVCARSYHDQYEREESDGKNT